MDEGALGRLTEAAGGSRAALAAAAARARADPGSCAVVLVEGMSDQAALEALAVRRGRDLRDEGVFVVPMGGATNIGHFLGLFGPGARPAGRRAVPGVSDAVLQGYVTLCRTGARSFCLPRGPQ